MALPTAWHGMAMTWCWATMQTPSALALCALTDTLRSNAPAQYSYTRSAASTFDLVLSHSLHAERAGAVRPVGQLSDIARLQKAVADAPTNGPLWLCLCDFAVLFSRAGHRFPLCSFTSTEFERRPMACRALGSSRSKVMNNPFVCFGVAQAQRGCEERQGME